MSTYSSKRNKPSLDDLFEDLAHPNPNINKRAYVDMATYWPKASIERLIGNLNTKDVELRRKSVKALGGFGDIALLPVVRIFFSSEDISVRTSCLKVFVKIAAIETYKSIPEPLIKVIDLSIKDDNPQINLSVVSLLRQLGKQGLPKLIEIAKQENVLLAKASVTAIGEIDDPSSVDCLKALSANSSIDKLVQESAIYSLDSYIKYLYPKNN
ncbi:HEAT repeat domain-containing protein [Prochlorococcus sp. MIT 1307]|uniref:HEAT repeat domain-containing protein n=1 Tax=Prochlorococcus sp. MIT 1307 TaxID=3096219 RepID=UPI002A755A0E|nr:HEAT repeat domain-containing protein [Prochlorococcus sp. MIT 1307]